MDKVLRTVEFEYLGYRDPILGNGQLVMTCYETETGRFLDICTLEEFTPTTEFSEPREVDYRRAP
jgi:hypothetical protein